MNMKWMHQMMRQTNLALDVDTTPTQRRSRTSFRSFLSAGALLCSVLALTACPPSTQVPDDPVEEPDPSPELPIVPTPESGEPEGGEPEPKEPEAFEPEEPGPEEPEPDAPTPDTPTPDTPTPDTPTPETPTPDTPTPDTPTPDTPTPEPTPEPEPVNECGDNTRGGTEMCDGTDIPLTCRDVGFAGGTIACKTSCDDVETTGCDPLVAAAIAAPGGTLGLSGSLDDTDPKFARPSATCGAGTVGGYYFDAHAITNNTGAQQTLDINAAWGTGDGFLLLYRSPFDPRSATGCVLANDDAGGTAASALTGVTIQAGETLVVVASAYDEDDAFGAYTIDVITEDVVGDLCGNDTLDSGEACDGVDFGTDSCMNRGFDRGDLACVDECQTIDASGCINDPPPPPTPIAVPGSSVSLSGSLAASDDTFVPVDDGCVSQGGASNHHFDALAIVNNTGAAQNVTLTATWTTGDGILSVHTDPFDAATAVGSCVSAGDDFGGIGQSRVESVLMAAGETFWVVATTFSGGAEIANYTIDVATDALSECGNNQQEEDEVCDGTDLNGTTCSTAGFTAGQAGCNASCTAIDLLGCYSPQGPVSVPPGGATDTFSGALNASDTDFDRPNTNCAPGSGQADHAYDIFEIVNNHPDARTFVVNGSFSGGTGSLLRYSSFDPRTPTAGCATFMGTDLGSITLGAGESIFVVVAAATGGGTVTSYTVSIIADEVAVCGDNVASGDEVCDGTDLGLGSCTGQGFDGGGLACAGSCQAFVADQCFSFESTTSIAAQGGTVDLVGTIDATDPIFDRPSATCGDSSLYDEHPFDAFVLENNTGEAQVITLTAAWSGDGYLHVYENFDSIAPLAGCVVGDDDFGTDGSQVEDVFIPAGGSVVVVASTFSEETIGDYIIEVETLPDPPLPLRVTPGLSVQLRGDITDLDEEWNRPLSTCGTLSATTGQRYQSFRVENTTASEMFVTLTGHWQNDGYLFVYEDGFDASDPLTGCLAGDDDFSANSQSLSSRKGSKIERLAIPAGGIRTVVASSFGNAPSAIGPYTIDILTDLATATDFVLPAAEVGASVATTGTVGEASPTWDAPDACQYTAAPANTEDLTFFHSAFYVENTAGTEIDVDIVVNWLDAGADGAVWAFIVPDETVDATETGGQCIGQNDDTLGPEFSVLSTYLFTGETVAIVPTSESELDAPGGYLLDVATVERP